MKLIKEYGRYFYRENPETNKIERVDAVKEKKPLMTLELENRLYPNLQIDLPFSIGKIVYDSLFVKELSFTTVDEVNKMMAILDAIKGYEDKDKPYAVISTLNCCLIIRSGNTEVMYDLENRKLADYIYGIISWMHEQDKYFIL